MNIPSDEVLAEAAKYANKRCGFTPSDDDVYLAREYLLDPDVGGLWKENIQAYIDATIVCDERTIAKRNKAEYMVTDFDTYERAVMALAFYPGRGTGDLSYPMLGLNGEAGEAAEQWKKALRDDGGKLTDTRREAVKKELGDVLWYVAACATEAGLSLREVAEANLTKLMDRAERGKLGGSGDER